MVPAATAVIRSTSTSWRHSGRAWVRHSRAASAELGLPAAALGAAVAGVGFAAGGEAAPGFAVIAATPLRRSGRGDGFRRGKRRYDGSPARFQGEPRDPVDHFTGHSGLSSMMIAALHRVSMPLRSVAGTGT